MARAFPRATRTNRRFSLAIAAILTFIPLASLANAELVQTMKARDRYVTTTIKSLLDAQHLSRHPLDDEISVRTFETFVKQLDPMKLYFYQADVDGFLVNKKLLDDQVRRGDISFAYKVFNVFLDRLRQRVDLVPTLLAETHDFTAKEELVIDPDAAEYPQNDAEARDRWRRRIKYDLLALKGDDVEGDEAVDRLTRRYTSYARRMNQYKPDDLLEIFLSALTTSYDPHTTYMSPTTLENFNISMKLKLDGIGAALSMVDGYTVVSRIIPGGAAAKQGELKPEDRIVSVSQGEDGEEVEVIDMRLNDVVQLIRGKAGTVVRLGVKTGGVGETKVVRIVRDRIELKDSEAKGEVIEGAVKPNGRPYRVGVIKLPSFYMDMRAARLGFANFKSTTRDVRRILQGFRRDGVDAVMLDLRFNGGGSLTEAIQLTGLFIDSGPVVQVKDPGRLQKYDDVEAGTAWDGPLVVVINKFSASASEILAGAVQDYGRGIVIGDKTTHGKGTVQSLLDLSEKLYPGITNAPNLGALKITMQQFYRPSGDSTQKRGVVSDVPLPSTTNEMDIGEADLDYAVQFDTVPTASFNRYRLAGMLPGVIQRLNTLSAQRRSESEDFQKEIERIERYKEQKDREYVSLNEEEFFARRKELDAEKEDEKTFKEIDDADETVLDMEDFYDKELFSITIDYVKALSPDAVARQ